MPFPELEPYTEPRRIVPRSQPSSWLEDEIRRDRDRNIRATIEAAPSPDQVARETVLARKANVAPIMIEGRLDEVERAQNTDSFLKVAERYPAIGRFAATNPRGAVAAQGDHESLGLLGSAFAAARRLQIAAGGQLYAGVNAASSMIWDTLATVDEIASTVTYPINAATATVAGAFGIDYDPDKNFKKSQSFFRSAAVQTDDYRQALAQETAFGNYWVDTTLQGLQSAPIMAVAAATRNPNAAATMLGAGTGAQGFQEALRSGASKGAAIRHGVTTGVAEGLLEKMPLSKLGEAIARKTPWAKSFIAQLAVEIPAEQVTTFLQDLSALAYLPENANKTFGEFLRERPQAALDTALATAGGVAATTGSIRAAQRASDVVSSVAGRLGMAVQARNEKKFFDEAANAVQGLNLRKRDPESLRELLRQQAEEAGAGNVFIHGEAVLEYQQSDAYDQRQDPFSKYDTSEGAGGDVVIPIEDVLTDMVGTPAWEAVRDHVRLTQGGMSTREAATFEESMADVMEGISQTMAREAQSERATQTVREKITDRLAGMFGTSYTAPVARDYAELAVTRMAARASRLGQELRDTNDLEVRQVMPEGVAEAIKADKLDLVVNAMRQRKPAETGEGRTLLEFIKARGGINDSGGDLKSMGVSPKLLRDFDPAQGSLGGVSGAGDFGIDTTLRAAIEEGFFPELAGVENEAGPSQLDTQALIDAIAEELAGSPRFASVREDLVRAAANDLRAMLEDAGLSPDEMSDAQVREAIEAMAERDAREGFEQLPDTLEIDGVQRSTRNSEGQQIAGTREGVKAFWRWFSDSKVVDAEGRPLVVYHGTPANVTEEFSFNLDELGKNGRTEGVGTYFTPTRAVAEHYAKDGNVIEAYIAASSPMTLTEKPLSRKETRRFIKAVVETEAKQDGADIGDGYLSNWGDVRSEGLNQVLAAAVNGSMSNETLVDQISDLVGSGVPAVLVNRVVQDVLRRDAVFATWNNVAGVDKVPVIVALNPENVKSVNNVGTFDPADPRILYQAAYHGSPHIFDRFSLDKIGTGEGAQAFGYGLYFTNKRDIAEHYRNMLAKDDNYALSDGTVWSPDNLQHLNVRVIARKNGTDLDATIRQAKAMLDGTNQTMREMIESDIAALESIKDGGGLKTATGRLYEVSIPEDDEFLLWDKPLNQQSPKVRDALKSLGFKIDSEERYPDTGGDIYQRMARGAQESAGGYLAAQRIASLDLLRNGVTGIKYRAGQLTDKTSPDAFNYVVFDPSRVSIRAYEQESRGRIIFEQNKRIIELFQSRNLSTPIHELSHMWLEELRFDAELPDAPEQLKTDWETVKAYFAANGHPVVDGIPVEAHELWARSGERYIMEGNAPSSALTRMFETFRSWLVNIYKAVDRLRAPITPEIREVFDRLLATDEEIADARERQSLSALFRDIADSGMNEAEFAAYSEQVANARADAHSTLIDKTMATVRRRAMERYQAARKTIRAEEQERIDGSPLYRAIAAMREQRISKRWVVEEMGEDALGLLPVRVPPLYADGGIDPSIVAELNGYSGATEMIEALIGAERAHRQAREGGDKRSMRERAIEAATDAEFSRRYGDPLNDGSIEREALAAVHSKQQGEVIASELRILARRSGKTPTPYRIARDWARGKVRGGTVVNEASAGAIQRYARNAAKAGRAAEAAMLEQNVDETFRQKQFQMFNNALVAEAKAAADEVDVAVRRMDKIARTKTRKSVDQDYLEQAQALLEAVDLRKRSQIGIERQGQWEEWSAQREAEGFDILTPPSFEATIGQTNWTRLSVDNLLALDEQIKQILHLGRLKQSLIDNQERREWDDIYREVDANADEIGRKPPKGSFTDPTWFDSVKARVATVDAALLKMEQVFDWLDRGNSNGAFNRVVFRPIADAQSREQDMTRDYFGRISEALEAVPAKTIRHWGDKVTLDLIDPETGLPAVFERKKLVAMALNWGNAGNRQRLADGYGWSPQGIESALMDNLTAEEWQFVQQAWDIIDTLWPEIERMERAVNGVAPEKVEAVEVVTPFGALRGGYYPAIYDTTLDYTAEEQAGRKTDLFESSYTRASTRASATKARVEAVSRPILLDIGVINRHLGEVIHDVTHREAVIRANKFLTSRKVMKAVDQTLGPEIRKQFRPWLQYIANSWAQDRAGNEGLGKFMSKARANTTVVGMGWRFTTMLTQAAGYSNSIEFVGAKWISAAIARTGAHPIETFDFVMDRSGEMRNRMDTLDRDIRKEIARMEGAVGAAGGKLTAVKRFAFHGIGYMDRVVSVPTWIGAYNKAIAGGMSEADAAFAGDKAVRLSQGAAAPKDLAAVATGQGRYGEAFKWMTMFYSYLSTVYSRQRNLGRDVRRAVVGDIPALLARAWWLVVVPPLLAEILSGRGPDDDEDSAWWAFRKMLSQSVGAIPGVRDVIEPALSGITGDFAFGYRLSPVSAVGESVVKTAKDVGKIARGEETTRATRDILETVGYFTGLVPGQVAASTQFLVDVGNGDADPETISEWYEGLTKGRIKEN